MSDDSDQGTSLDYARITNRELFALVALVAKNAARLTDKAKFEGALARSAEYYEDEEKGDDASLALLIQHLLRTIS